MVPIYMYDRELLNTHKLRMKPIGHEDEEFTPRAIYFARRIQYVPIRVYNYLQRNTSFMGNYNPQGRLALVRAMKSLHDFAARIEAEDSEGAELLRLHIGKTMLRSCKQTVIRQLGDTGEMLRLARQLGIMPLKSGRPISGTS